MDATDIGFYAGVIQFSGAFHYREGSPIRITVNCPTWKRDQLEELKRIVGGGSIFDYQMGPFGKKKAYSRLSIQKYSDVKRFIEIFNGRFKGAFAKNFEGLCLAFQGRNKPYVRSTPPPKVFDYDANGKRRYITGHEAEERIRPRYEDSPQMKKIRELQAKHPGETLDQARERYRNGELTSFDTPPAP